MEAHAQLRTIRRSLITAVVALFVFPLAALAADLYVDCDPTHGSDTTNCQTIGTPCATLTYAESQLPTASADTVHVDGACAGSGSSYALQLVTPSRDDDDVWQAWEDAGRADNNTSDIIVNPSGANAIDIGGTVDNVTIQDFDQIGNCTFVGITITNATNITIQNNIVSFAGTGFPASGIAVNDNSGGVSGIYIRNNTIRDSGGDGVQLNVNVLGSTVQDVWIEKNVIYDNAQSGISSRGNSRFGLYLDDLLLYNNILYGNGGSQNIAILDNTDTEIIHNTLSSGSASGSEIDIANCGNNPSNGCLVTNNIVVPASGGAGIKYDGGSFVSCDYNLIYSAGGTNNIGIYNGTPYTTLAGWQGATGGDANSQDADPQLDGTYHIPSGSPAENSGTNTLPRTFDNLDIDGDSRPLGDPNNDQGADERGDDEGAVPEYSLLTLIIAIGLGLGTFGFVRHKHHA